MKIDYKSSGVDIHEGYKSVEKIKNLASKTLNSNVLSMIGSFGALMRLPEGYKKPVLVSGTDGVGTKLKVAFALEKYDTFGIDAVAMCVNDILCHGAEPLFFLDYLACGKLDSEISAQIVKGVADGCLLGELALIGGETAEMPGFYEPGEYDIAGFAVGVVEEDKIIDGKKVKEGDVLIGLKSSGFHSNGYSLIRKLFTDYNEIFEGRTIGEHLIEPTRIYVKSVRALLEKVDVHSMAHITGGGFIENIPRMYPGSDLTAFIDKSSYEVPPIFNEAIKRGADPETIYNTFNMGIGFVIAVSKEDKEETIAVLKANGEDPVEIGYMGKGSDVICIK
ncbi:MAG: phosphoribosylformylglycinamidine cyclo-ligase [Clostridiaceae bacterium]